MTTNDSDRTRRHVLATLSVLAVLIGFGVLGSLAWRAGRPEHLWKLAQAALEEGDRDAARLHLESLLNRVSDHAEAHRALARVWSETDVTDRAERAQADVRSLQHLTRAARLRSDDLELQRELMRSLQRRGHLREAAAVAVRVAALDPKDVEARYLLAWQAVDERNHARAEAALDQLEQQQSKPSFRTLALRAKWAQIVKRDELVTKALGTSARLANELDLKELRSLERDERRAMCTLLLLSQFQAAGADQAHRRASALLSVLERLEQVSANDREAARERAETAARATAALFGNHPVILDAPTELARDRTSILTRAEHFFRRGIEVGHASPLIYHQAALVAITRGAEDRAIQILDSGIAASGDLSHRRRSEVLALQLLAARRLVLARHFDRARPHIDALLSSEATAGWGHLIAGAVDVADGRPELALKHFLEAHTRQGATFLVRLALAHTYLTLSRYDEALPQLTALDVDFDQLNPEEQAWVRRFVGDRLQIRLAKARCHLVRDDWRSAAQELDALAGTRLEPEALRMIIAHHFDSGRREQARQALEVAWQRFPNDVGLAAMRLAELTEAGDLQSAEQLAVRFAAEHPENLAARLLIVQWLARRGRLDEALQEIKPLETQFAGQSELARIKGPFLLAAGRPQQAMRVAEALRQRSETAAAGAALAVQIALQQGEAERAAQHIKAAAQLGVSEGQIRLWEAAVASTRGDHRRAIDALATALTFRDLRTPARIALVASLLNLAVAESAPAAAATLRELKERFPNEPALLFVEAELALANDRSDVARQTLDRLDGLQPDSPSVPLLRARVWLSSGRRDLAVEEVERALARSPRYAAARIMAAQLDLERGHFAGAMRHAEIALKLDSGLLEMHLVQADALDGLGRRHEAIARLGDVIDSASDFLPAHLRLAALQEADGERQAALDTVRKARTAAPLDALLLQREIHLLHRLDRVNEAEALADRLARDNPTASVRLVLARAFYEAGNLTTAARFAGAIGPAEEQDDQSAAHWLSGNIAFQLGRRTNEHGYFEKARLHYQAVLEREPSHLIVANNLTWLWSEVFQRPDKALVLVRRIRALVPGDRFPPEVVDTLVTVLRRSGRLDEAVSLLKEAAPAHHNNPLYQFQLAMVYAAGQKHGAAEAALEQALRFGLDDSRAAEARRALDSLASAPAG